MSYFDVFSLILGSSWIHHCQYCRRKTELLTTTLLLELKSEDKNSGIFACLFRCCLFSNLNQEIISAQTTSTRVFSTIMHTTTMKSIFMTFFNFVKPFIPAVLPLFNKTLFKTLVIFNQAFQCFIVTTLCFFIMSHKLYLSMRVLFYTNKNELQQSSRFSIYVFSDLLTPTRRIFLRNRELGRKQK